MAHTQMFASWAVDDKMTQTWLQTSVAHEYAPIDGLKCVTEIVTRLCRRVPLVSAVFRLKLDAEVEQT